MGNSSTSLSQLKKHVRLELSEPTPSPWLEIATSTYKDCLPDFEEWLLKRGLLFNKTFPRNGVTRYEFRRISTK